MTTLLHEGPTILQWGVVLGASCAAGLIDLRTRQIPNLLTFPMLLGGYAAAAWAGGVSGLADAGMASVLLSAPYVLLFVFAGGGAVRASASPDSPPATAAAAYHRRSGPRGDRTAVTMVVV